MAASLLAASRQPCRPGPGGRAAGLRQAYWPAGRTLRESLNSVLGRDSFIPIVFRFPFLGSLENLKVSKSRFRVCRTSSQR